MAASLNPLQGSLFEKNEQLETNEDEQIKISKLSEFLLVQDANEDTIGG